MVYGLFVCKLWLFRGPHSPNKLASLEVCHRADFSPGGGISRTLGWFCTCQRVWFLPGQSLLSRASAHKIQFVGDGHPHFTLSRQGRLPSAPVTRRTGRGRLSATTSCLARGRGLLRHQGLASLPHLDEQNLFGLSGPTAFTGFGGGGGTPIFQGVRMTTMVYIQLTPLCCPVRQGISARMLPFPLCAALC